MTVLMRMMALVAAGVLALGAPAFAGGDDYDAANDTEGAGPAYFGFVRDQRGAPVSDAQVFLTPKSGQQVALKTNVLGLYRSHVNKDTLPDDVAISCEKDGYRQDKVFRRTPPGAKDMFIETDCTLRRL
ncbi:hypothetical protein [Rhodoplanes sp. Z2-YC6860]|uniref:hypothetical protein n=1 Tax=Rhodoplanes sp. Z2-YC6860 TaxID=674703 RepID=UPI00082BDEB9|nr:hypothetical protein [Rhodoplanes sp. Z2-YC6860]